MIEFEKIRMRHECRWRLTAAIRAQRARIPSQSTDQSAGQARTGTGTVRSRDCLDAPGDNSPGKSSRTYDGMVKRRQRQPGAVIMSAGRAPRPRSRPGYSPRARTTSGQCRVPVSYMRVWMTCSRLGPGWPSASPVSRRHSRGCSCGPAGGAAACPQAGLRAGGHQSYRHLRDVRYGRQRCASIAPGGT